LIGDEEDKSDEDNSAEGRSGGKVLINDKVGDDKKETDSDEDTGDFGSECGRSDFDDGFSILEVSGAGKRTVTSCFEGVFGKFAAKKSFEGFGSDDESTADMTTSGFNSALIKILVGSVGRQT
jgi:hypothetical protein